MSKDFDLPVVPVATNLGCFWKQQEKTKTPGVATIEFLPALPQRLEKDEFMTLMQATIEGRTNELIAQARGEPVKPSVLVEWDGKKNVHSVGLKEQTVT
jgi:1-acyl-sn-glycerol-3-phosphate acyltransferase